VFLSVVIPTVNRRPILEKCLRALERQVYEPSTIAGYEVVVVDDGSTDGTVEWLQAHADAFPHVRRLEQEHLGPAAARNLGVQQARGDVIVFIDSDLVVTERFLQAHAEGLLRGARTLGHDRLFTYGAVVNTSNFDDPASEPRKFSDFSAAYFATGNVAIARRWLEEAGLFDTRFQQYGWEDLELGVRLKKMGLALVKCPDAVGYHWHPTFSMDQVARLIDKEVQRGRMGVLFYQKHPEREVRMMIQMTRMHQLLWGLLSLGGLLNERTLRPLQQWLVDIGKPRLALGLARIYLNWYTVRAVHRAHAELRKGEWTSA
jgi:glycosyltransferase involved in cell wall biosynthesis